MQFKRTDVLVIGSGLSGLFASLVLAERGLKVLIVTKEEIDISNSHVAQGGIATVIDLHQDSFQKHIEDTITAGAGLNRRDAVDFFVKRGPETIESLRGLGVHFSTRDDGNLDLGWEGGHTERRVVHAGDITGNELISVLKERVVKDRRITIWQHHTAIDLITTRKFTLAAENRAVGAYVLTQEGAVITVEAGAVLLATGGCGKVYLYTSNPDVATGDGVAIGFRAGVPAVNMEMVQFHPTILYHEKVRSMLLSEALRGEGGILRTRDGRTFMEKYHPMKSLAPRDVTARAIDHELKKRGDDFVLLDMTMLDPDFIVNRFPNLFKKCFDAGIDMRRDPIPVVPAAHYMCGGLQCSPEGTTCVPGLFVAGEVAHTGLHGANRLASNSLLEAAVMARYAAEEIVRWQAAPKDAVGPLPLWNEEGVSDSEENVVVKQNWDEIRHCMWNYVGIVRSDRRLERALKRISLIKQEITEYYWNFKVTRDLLELRNITLVAEIIVRSAMKRKESRGLHYNTDHPQKLADAHDTELSPEELLG
ncbi:MAG TPA: L-aspartate oxidase [bacterium]|nr:L-aspartate oxidase [bacterium]